MNRYVIGDAVTGVHFFSGTGVNTGFKLASIVSDSICEILTKGEPIEKSVKNVRRSFKIYTKEAMDKSKAVILKTSTFGKCQKSTITELRKFARDHHYKGISNLPKSEQCLLMANAHVQ